MVVLRPGGVNGRAGAAGPTRNFYAAFTGTRPASMAMFTGDWLHCPVSPEIIRRGRTPVQDAAMLALMVVTMLAMIGLLRYLARL